MTDTDELIAFLTAQYDRAMEREQGKRKISPFVSCHCGETSATLTSREPSDVVFECGHRMANEEFTKRFTEPAADPYVLADIASKRRILTEIMDEANSLDDSLDLERRVGDRDLATEPRLGDLLAKILAEPFASRDGYKETWRP